MSRILVTGASGSTGRPLVQRLRAARVTVRTATRTPRPEPRSGPGEHVSFDWMDPKTHDAALEGIDRIYLLGPGLVADVDAIVIPFVRRALDRGVRRFVMLSASAVPEGTPGLGTVHAFLRRHAPEWAVLQPSWFMQNFIDLRHHHARGLLDGQLVTATGDGRVGFVDARDIADVAAHALLDAEPHDTAHVITGPEALGYDDIAARLSHALGRTIEHRAVDPQTLVRHLVDHEIPKPYAELLAKLDRDIRKGEHAQTTDTVMRITGHAPRSFDAFVREYASRWG